VIALTHFAVGLTLAYVLDKRLVTASAFALVPSFDKTFDFLYPFTQRGIMHSFLAAGLFTSLVYIYTEDRGSAESCFLGYSSAILLETLTSSGAPLLFPLPKNFALDLTTSSSLEGNLAILSLCTVLVFAKKHPKVFQTLYNWR